MSAENKLGIIGNSMLAATLAVGVIGTEVASGNQECRIDTWQAHYGDSLKNGDYLQVLNEKAQQRFEQGMDLWEHFVDIDANPEMKKLHQLTEIIPTSYIETEDNFQIGDSCAIDGFNMYIYDNPGKFGKGKWTVMIQMHELENINVGTIYIQLDEDLELFDGDGNNLSPANHLPFDEYVNLALQSNNLFNVPEELMEVAWVEQIVEDTPESNSTSTYFDRKFRGNGDNFFQAVLPERIVLFGSTFQPKSEHPVDSPRINPSDNRLV